MATFDDVPRLKPNTVRMVHDDRVSNLLLGLRIIPMLVGNLLNYLLIFCLMTRGLILFRRSSSFSFQISAIRL